MSAFAFVTFITVTFVIAKVLGEIKNPIAFFW